MKTKNLYLGFVFVALLGAASLMVYLKSQNKTEVSSATLPASSNAEAVQPAQQTATSTAQNTQSQPAAKLSESSLQVQGNLNPANSQAQEPTLPEPAEFGVYEQYAANSSSLYIDVLEGTGAEAKSGDTVMMLYKGWLTDGTLFDQSRMNEQNQIEPFSFRLGAGQVIQGWEQTIAGMKVGGQRRLIIPSELGYGSSGQGSIPADSMLIFDVQLVSIQ